jgi:hypothetical protein
MSFAQLDKASRNSDSPYAAFPFAGPTARPAPPLVRLADLYCEPRAEVE